MIKKGCILILKFYRKFISPVLKSECIFTPTCSEYAIEAFLKRNFFVAAGLIVWRLLRCNSLNAGGFDPVPDSYNKLKWVF